MLEAEDGYKGLYLAARHSPSLIILDQVMPGFDGLEVLAELRNDPRTKNIPVIMRSVMGSLPSFRYSAFQKGAIAVETRYKDNLKEIPKALELAMLEEQVKRFFDFISNWAVTKTEDDTEFFRADILNHAAILGDGRRVFLGDKEFKLYYLLKLKKGGFASREEIMRYVYDQEGYDASTDAGTINALANELRSKLNLEANHPRYKDYLKMMRDRGYRLEEP